MVQECLVYDCLSNCFLCIFYYPDNFNFLQFFFVDTRRFEMITLAMQLDGMFDVWMFCWVKLFTMCSIFPTAVTCWVCFPSPVLQSNSRVQQKLGVVALPYTSMFTLFNTAVTCWVCFPSLVLLSSSRVKQKLGVVALPYTLMFILLLLMDLLVLVLVLVSVLMLLLPYHIQQ